MKIKKLVFEIEIDKNIDNNKLQLIQARFTEELEELFYKFIQKIGVKLDVVDKKNVNVFMETVV